MSELSVVRFTDFALWNDFAPSAKALSLFSFRPLRGRRKSVLGQSPSTPGMGVSVPPAFLTHFPPLDSVLGVLVHSAHSDPLASNIPARRCALRAGGLFRQEGHDLRADATGRFFSFCA